MLLRLAPLVLTTFAMGTQGFVFTGLLADLARDLEVSLNLAGLLIALYAITFALSAPVLVQLTGRFARRRLLVIALVALAVINLGAALAPQFETLLGLRVAAGLGAALATPTAQGMAVMLVAPAQRGRALALVLGGIMAAFLLGIPLGSVVGEVFGWRGTFALAAVMAGVAAVSVAVAVPALPGAPRSLQGAFAQARPWRLMAALSATALAFTAVFCVMAYVGPVVTAATGITDGRGIAALQTFVGLGGIVGLIAGGLAADRLGARPEVVVTLMLLIGLSMGGTSVLIAAGSGGEGGAGAEAGAGPALLPAIGMAGVIGVSAAALFALSPIIQRAVVEATPNGQTLALSLNGSMIFLGQGLGAGVGGQAIERLGMTQIGTTGLVLAALAIAVFLFLDFRARGVDGRAGMA